jgi:hypothetical protein
MVGLEEVEPSSLGIQEQPRGGKVVPKESKEVTKDTWKPTVGLEDGAEVVEEQGFFWKYVDCFVFVLHDLGILKGQEVRINLTDDAPIYRKPYKYSDVEYKMIQARTKKLVEAGLVELAPPDCEYASATVMPSKKDIYGNWIEKRMCGDYRKINKFTIGGFNKFTSSQIRSLCHAHSRGEF